MLRIGTGLLLLLPILAAGCASSADTAPAPPTVEEVRELRGRVDRLEGDLASRQAELKSLKKGMAELRGENQSLLLELAGLRGEQLGLKIEVSRLRSLLDESKKPVPDPAPVPEGDPTRLPVDAKVLAVDARIGIYLVSVGSRQGVKTADELTVYRGDQFVAVVVVDKVFEDKASAELKRVDGKAFRKSDIKVGDRVARVE